MEHYLTTKPKLPDLLVTLNARIPDALFRGLGEKAEQEYARTGKLLPKDGDYSVGTGVFFTDKPSYATSFMHRTLILTSRTLLDSQNTAIDTRRAGYYAPFEEELKAERGVGNYTCWDIEARTQAHDTITQGPDCIIYTSRKPLTQEHIIATIEVAA